METPYPMNSVCQIYRAALINFLQHVVRFGLSSKRMRSAAILLLPVCAPAFASTFYKCTDDSGRILFTNTQPRGKSKCIVLAKDKEPSRASVPASGSQRVVGRASAIPTPSDFPRVLSHEQRARDSDRRTILEGELSKEQALYAKAKKLAATDSSGAQANRDITALHERNIKALQKEISNLR